MTTEANIRTFRQQLDNIGFCYDWSRQINTSHPGYYKWTQHIFLQLFGSWYNRHAAKAEPIETLVRIFEAEGNIHQECPGDRSIRFSADTGTTGAMRNNSRPSWNTASLTSHMPK